MQKTEEKNKNDLKMLVTFCFASLHFRTKNKGTLKLLLLFFFAVAFDIDSSICALDLFHV